MCVVVASDSGCVLAKHPQRTLTNDHALSVEGICSSMRFAYQSIRAAFHKATLSRVQARSPVLGLVLSLATCLVWCVCASALLSGCKTRIGGGGGSDTGLLRARADDLARQVETLTLRANEAEANALRVNAALSADVVAAIPNLAVIEIDKLSGPSASDTTSFPVFVRTLDARRRFIQVVGTLTVRAWAYPSGTFAAAGSKPIAVASVDIAVPAKLTPLELREAYRSGVMGTHYRVELAVIGLQKLRNGQANGQISGQDIVISVAFTDALTGKTYEANRKIPARVPSAAGGKWP